MTGAVHRALPLALALRALLVAGAWLTGTAVPAAAQRDSLDLAAALAIARERSPLVRAGQAGVRSAEGQLARARASRAPRVAADALYLRVEDPPVVTLGPLGTLAPVAENGYFVQVGVRQPIYTGGRVRAAMRAAEWASRAAVATNAQTDVELTAAVAHAHDAVLLARALLDVAESGAATLDSAAALAQRHFAAGTVSRLDVLQAETRLASAQADVRAAGAALAAAQDQLATVAGLDPDSAPPAAGALEPAAVALDSAALAGLLARARAARPDIEALRAGARAAEAGAAAARAALRPAAALFVSGLLTRPELATGRQRWDGTAYGGLVVSWPLLDFGAAAGEAATARAEADRLEAEAARGADAAAAGVRAQAREIARATADIAAGRENVQRAERALELARVRYADGIGIQLEVLEAQAALTDARAALQRAMHAHRSAAVELRRAAGLPADAPLGRGPSRPPGDR